MEGAKGTPEQNGVVSLHLRAIEQKYVCMYKNTAPMPPVMLSAEAWPVILTVSVAWLLCCVALIACAARDIFWRCKEIEHSHEHPATALYRRNSRDKDGLSDILASEGIDTVDYYELGDAHPQPTLAYPIPGRGASHSHVHYDSCPRRPRFHAAISTSPEGPSSGRPILAWSAAAD